MWLINIFGLYLFSKMLEDVTDLEFITKVDSFTGHTTINTALAFSLYLIFKDKVKNETFLLFLAIIYPLVISFSRVYLNVHYLSDVFAGIGLGLFSVSLIYLSFKFFKV